MSIKTLIREELENEMDYLNKMEVGTEQYKTAVDGVTKLADRVIELEKFEVERKEKAENREIEYDLKLKQFEDERKDRFIKNCIAVGTAVGGMGLAVWGTVTSMKFEKEDSFTSLLGRGWVNKTVSFFKK